MEMSGRRFLFMGEFERSTSPDLKAIGAITAAPKELWEALRSLWNFEPEHAFRETLFQI